MNSQPSAAPHSSTPLPEGYRHLALGDVGSTNSECLERAHAGDAGALWITGRRQLHGRGSRGRGWVSEAGNLYASLLLRNAAPLVALPQLAFVTALAVRDAIISLGADEASVTLKWPNDVLIDGKKTCGILLESHQLNEARYAIIGIGLNVAHFPQNTLHPATCLMEHGMDHPLDDIFAALAAALAERMAQWRAGEGFEEIRKHWLAACARRGEPIKVVLAGPDGAVERGGIFIGISESGELLLDEGGGQISRLSVADIFFA